LGKGLGLWKLSVSDAPGLGDASNTHIII